MAEPKPQNVPVDEVEAVKPDDRNDAQVGYQDISDEFPAKKRKKVLLKMDSRIVPMLLLLYLLSYIDRANIGNAKIEGIEADLDLTPRQFQIVLSVFFISYILFEVPSNWIMEKWFPQRPSVWMGIIATAWGVMMTLHGCVNNYGGLISVRFLMGLFEAGLFPGAISLMNKWYTRYEMGTRVAIFYMGSALSGAFSGLLAFAIAKMDGIAGLQGWRWIFIIEGIATVVVGVLVPFILSDTPERRPKWLNEEETDYLIRRMVAQNGGERADAEGKKVTFSLLKEVVTDWQYYPLVLCYWSNTVPNYGFKFTLPQIIKNMGYTSSQAQLLSIPPYVAGAISALFCNVLADKFRRRSWFLAAPQSLILIAYCVLIPFSRDIKNNIGACFFAVILANIGFYPITPGTSSWGSNNSAGAAKRSVGMAFILSLSSCGGIFASYIFIESEKPAYPTGFGVSMAAAVAGLCAVCFLDWRYGRINKQRDRMTMEEISEKYTEEELAKLGNRSPLFRYVL